MLSLVIDLNLSTKTNPWCVPWLTSLQLIYRKIIAVLGEETLALGTEININDAAVKLL